MKIRNLLILFIFIAIFWVVDVKADTLNITLTGTHYYDNAANIITMMNTERNSRGLDSVVIDRDLTIMANSRAKELALFFSSNHVRPDGTDAYASYGYDYESTVAGKYDSSATAYNYFVGNENYFPYMMSSTVKSVGVACFGTQNGYYYWVIVYSNSFSYNPSTLTGSSVKNEGVLINSNNITNIRVDDLGNWNHASLGDVYALNGLSIRNNGFGSAYTYVNNSNADWLSFDHTIATIDSNGVIRTHKRGTTTIQVTLGSASKSYSFVVDAAEVPITDIVLNTNNITMDEGTSRTISGTVYPTNTTEDKTLIFRSLNEDVAIVNKNGVVTGVAPGDTTITVSTASGDVVVTCAVVVNEIEENPDVFQLPHENMTIAPGSSYNLSEGTENITWTSSDESVCVVDQNGNVVGVGVGTATITATTEDGQSDTCFFSVSDEFAPESVVEVDQDEVILKAGEQTELNVTVDGVTPGDSTVTWSSSDESVVTVDQEGNVTAVGDGTATIIAIFEDGSSSTCEVTVSGMLVEPDGVSANYASLVLNVGDTATIKPTVTPENATNKSVSFDSDSPSVATVDENGVVTGVGVGNCVITVTTLNGFSTHVNVTVNAAASAVIRSIHFEEESYEMFLGQKQTLNVIFDADDGANRALTFESSKTSVVSIEGNILNAVGEGEATITATATNGLSTTCKVKVINKTPSVAYHTHIQDLGDSQGYMRDGAPAGTSHQSRRLESIKIKLENLPYSGSIRYVTHVQDLGWEDEKLGYWKMDDQISGTEHQSKRLEAIKIFLRGDISSYYDVYYRVHAQSFGWMGWAKNGEMAGTAGYSYRLEAIEIVLVLKGQSPPERTDTRTAVPFAQKRVMYSTHIQNIGWQDTRFDGNMSGTSHESKRLEAITLSLYKPDQLYGAGSSILYSTHIEKYGWEDQDPNRGWKRNGEMSGTSHESKRLEAIKIKLSGVVSLQYDVYYRVHAQSFGWMGWAKNGEPAGTAHYSYRLEAIEVILVPKGEEPPTRTDTKTQAAFKDARP